MTNEKYLYTVTPFVPNPTWVKDGWETQPWQIEKWEILPRTCAGAYHIKSPWGAVYAMAKRVAKDGSVCGSCNFNLYPTPKAAIIARQRELENEIEWSSSVIALAKAGLEKAAGLMLEVLQDGS